MTGTRSSALPVPRPFRSREVRRAAVSSKARTTMCSTSVPWRHALALARCTKACSRTAGECSDEACMMPFDPLERRGFSRKLAVLVRDGFPGKGSYQGSFHGLCG